MSAVFLYEKRDGARRDHFIRNQRYILREETRYSDGTCLQSGRHIFALDDDAAVTWIEMADHPFEVFIVKLDRETKSQIRNAVLQITDGVNQVLEEWVTNGSPHRIESKLMADTVYYLVEATPPDGYGLAEPIPFTLLPQGGILTIRMEDQPVQVVIRRRNQKKEGSWPVPSWNSQMRMEK